ncbi:MAG: DUF4160 domain-containing protein [Proteobacteria bacterium]|nr:DUF4160 domain-containing protein [Pseudomonadota bacterium]
MYFGDHVPPHFHIVCRDGSEALVAIATLAVFEGAVRPGILTEALTWARANRALLVAKWKELH